MQLATQDITQTWKYQLFTVRVRIRKIVAYIHWCRISANSNPVKGEYQGTKRPAFLLRECLHQLPHLRIAPNFESYHCIILDTLANHKGAKNNLNTSKRYLGSPIKNRQSQSSNMDKPWKLTLETNPDKQSYPKPNPWPLSYLALSVLYRRSGTSTIGIIKICMAQSCTDHHKGMGPKPPLEILYPSISNLVCSHVI